MFDFKLNEQNDISIVKGSFVFTTSVKELVKQRLEVMFKTFLGEWFLNTDFGGFDRDLMFSKRATKEILDSYYQSLIRSYDEVIGINFFESHINTSNRVYSFIFEITTIEGDVTYGVNFIPPGVEISYPYFPTELEAIGCSPGVSIPLANRLYELLNIELPSTIPWF